jgi:hypothetical protein
MYMEIAKKKICSISFYSLCLLVNWTFIGHCFFFNMNSFHRIRHYFNIIPSEHLAIHKIFKVLCHQDCQTMFTVFCLYVYYSYYLYHNVGLVEPELTSSVHTSTYSPILCLLLALYHLKRTRTKSNYFIQNINLNP